MTPNSPTWLYNPIEPLLCPPEQFFPTPATSWMKRLLFAVLEEAAHIAGSSLPNGYGRRAAHRIRQEARNWFESDDLSYPFAFLVVCQHLGLDALRIRRRVMEPGFKLISQGFRTGAHGLGKVGSADLIEEIDMKTARRARQKGIRL